MKHLRPILNLCMLCSLIMAVQFLQAQCGTAASFTYQHSGGGVVQFTNTSTGATAQTWSFTNASGVILTSTASNPTFTYTGLPPYGATLIASSGINCSDTANQSVTLPVTCVTLTLDSSGKDSEVSDYFNNANTNYGDVIVFASYIWSNGVTFRERALFEFDFSSIPANATIANASLSLYADDPTLTFVGNPSTPMNGTNNASSIRRITSAWGEHTVTWNNQPGTTTANQIILPTSTNPNQDYTGVDITPLVQDAITLGNFGFMIQPVSTTPSNSMIFRSGDHSIASERPTLQICYILDSCTAAASFTYQHLGGGNVQFTNTSTGATAQNWTFTNASGVLSTSTASNPTFTYSGLPPYGAMLSVSNGAGCTDTITQQLNLPVTCITLTLDSSSKDSEVSDYFNNASTNYGDVTVFASYIWSNGVTFRERALVEFDFSSIPANATIANASLSLYADDPTATFVGNPSTPMNGTNNASFIRRITSAWDEHTVTWNNQPGTTTANQITLPTSTNPNQDYVGVDITPLVQDAITLGNFGFMIQPVSTTPSNSMIFRSGDHAIAADRPTLEICYFGDSTVATGPATDTLCGMVFNDANSNRIYDFGETQVANAKVRIDNYNFYTDNAGFYKAAVPSGTHTITLIAPAGWVQTAPDTPLTYTVATQAGDHICGLDFGMRDDTLILSGLVYNDNNGDGLYNTGDTPRAGSTVYVNGTNGNYTVVTNSQGVYAVMVYSGAYNVSYNVPNGFTKTQPISPGTYSVTLYNTSMAGLNFGVRSNTVTISGKLFVDANNNGVFDSGELAVGSQAVVVGGSIVYTNASGNWSIVKPAGTYTVSYTPTGFFSGYNLTTSGNITVNATTLGSVYGNNNFGVYLTPGVGDVCVTLDQMTTVTPALGLAGYVIAISNYGNIPMTGTLEMTYDPLLSFHSSNIAPTSLSMPNYFVTWQLTVPIGQTIYVRPSFDVSTSAQLGDNVFNYVFFNPAQGFTDVNMDCNDDTLHQQVLTAYDPNDKYVSPLGYGSNHAILNVGQSLDYTIMFQNTGNAPAANVILKDTVEEDLDLSSFQMRSASHSYHVQIEGRVITWIFSNIMLPDSNTNVDSSIGYVAFNMNANTNLTQGTLVTNNAGIYFDYNEVIPTGTAFNTIDKATGIADIAGYNVVVQPNPFTTYTTLVIENADTKLPYTLKVYDVTGKLVIENTNAGNTIRIERGGMAEGVYTYEVKQNNELITRGKLIAR